MSVDKGIPRLNPKRDVYQQRYGAAPVVVNTVSYRGNGSFRVRTQPSTMPNRRPRKGIQVDDDDVCLVEVDGGGSEGWEDDHDGYWDSPVGSPSEAPAYTANNSSAAHVSSNDAHNSNSKKKQQAKSGNHLLNFSYPRQAPPPVNVRSFTHSKRSIQHLAFKRERFVQANYRFVVAPGNFSECIGDPDSVVDWDLIEQIVYPTPVEYECVICLTPPTCAKMARCGHVFCYCCLIRYFGYATGQSMPCPVCLKERIYLHDLRSVLLQTVPKYEIGNIIEFGLLNRLKHTTVLSLCLSEDGSVEEGSLPIWGDEHSPFNRLNTTYTPLDVLRREEAELEAAIQEASSARDDSLPFLLTAKELTEEKILKYIPLECVNKEKLISRNEAKLSKAPVVPTEQDSLFFYQAGDGQLIFLHPLNVKWLVLQYGAFSAFPHSLSGKIIDFEDLSQDEATRKRYKYLAHLPITCAFKFCLIELDDILQDPTHLQGFKADLARRAEKHAKEMAEQERIAAKVAKRHKEIQESDPFRSTMLHFAPPAAEGPLDINSSESFPSVSVSAELLITPVDNPAPARPKKNAWTKNGPPQVKEQFPALGGASAPIAAPTWGRSLTQSAPASASPASQNNSKSQPQPKKKGKQTIMLFQM